MVGSSHSEQRERVLTALQQHEGALMRYAARMLGDRESALDVVQHAFLKLCSQQGDQFPQDPKPWLFKVCRNRILDLLRQAGRRPETLPEQDTCPSDSVPDPADLAEQRDLCAWLQSLVDQLPPSQREVILLWCQGLRYGQIAEITNLSEGGVRVKVHRGFVRLREHPAVRELVKLESADLTRQTLAADPSLARRDRVS